MGENDHVLLREFIERVFEERWHAHVREHEELANSIRLLAKAERETAELHAIAHGQEHAAHAREHTLQQTALDKAEVVITDRLRLMNEIREQLATQRAEFVSRESVDERLTGLGSKVDLIVGQNSDRISTMERRQGQYLTDTQFSERISGMLTKSDVIHADQSGRLEVLRREADNMAGRMWMLGAALTMLMVVLTLVSHFIK